MPALFNWSLAKEPMNWVIVWIAATIALLLFHVVMQGFGAMQAGSIGAAPGQVAAPVPTPIANQPVSAQSSSLGTFFGGAPQPFTDGFESKYAEDGASFYNG